MSDYEYLFRRCNHRVRENRVIWARIRAACQGGEPYIRQALIRHVSEIEPEFAERLRRAYYFNYPRKIAGMITQFVLSAEPQRQHALPELTEDFSRSGLRVNEVMRQLSTLLNLYGSAAMAVDMPYFEGEVDFERKRKEKLRPSVKVLSPLEVVDWAWHRDGALDWMLIEENTELSAGVFNPAVRKLRRKLLTREETMLFERGKTGEVRLIGRTCHHLGMVPAVYAADADSFGLGFGHNFEDIVRISDAILNNESELQMNIIKQMFGLLVISDSFARSGRSAEGKTPAEEKFSHVLARSAAIYESAEERGISRYISPAGASCEAIREANATLKQELFDLAGMPRNEYNNQSVSAESKAYDFHRVKQFLSSRVDVLEQSERQCWIIMHAFDPSIPVPEITYNREFSVSDLRDSLASLLEIKEFSSGKNFERELRMTALFLLEKIRKFPPERREAVIREIEAAEAAHA